MKKAVVTWFNKMKNYGEAKLADGTVVFITGEVFPKGKLPENGDSIQIIVKRGVVFQKEGFFATKAKI